jgi:cytoskeletal protein CcmA (bactofilin family)
VARDDAGYVLLWVIFGFVVMGAVATAALLAASTERRSSKAVSDWGRSLYLAETGIQEIMATVTDSALDQLNPGDSMVIGRTALPQGGSYTGVLHRVDDGGQLMYSLSVQGKRRGTMSGVHTVAMVVTRAKPPAGSAVAVDGDLLISGSPTITGTCGDLSVDGRLTVSGTLTIEGNVNSLETVIGGSIVTTDGRKLSTATLDKTASTPDDVPDVDVETMCKQADTWVDEGQVSTTREPTCLSGGNCTDLELKAYEEQTLSGGSLSLEPVEVKYDPSTETTVLSGASAPEGTVCLDGGLVISGELGTESDPVEMTVVADGDVEISGNPHMIPDDPDGVLIEATGDLKLNGNSSLAPNYSGDIRAGGQCEVSGAPSISGQLTCGDAVPVPGDPDLVTGHEISGDMSIHYDCASAGGGGSSATAGVLRPIRSRAWRQRY